MLGARAAIRSAPILLPFDRARELDELREYLGVSYDPSRMERWEERLDEEYAASADEDSFYRSSEAYLYNLTRFATSRTKLPYLRDLTRFVSPPARVLDYGCGIGSDGLLLAEVGYSVAFADFDNPSARYLRWRLARRGIEAPVHDLDRDPPAGGFEVAFAFDVIEHVEDPFDFLARLEKRARLVLVNLLESEPEQTPLHRDLPIEALLDHATRRELLLYRRYYDRRSHLILYGSEIARGADRARSWARRVRGTLSR